MSTLSLNMNMNNQAVTVLFNWYGEEPDWEGMKVIAWLPSAFDLNVKFHVDIADVISDDDWKKIEHEIYWNEDKLKRQAMAQEY